MQVRQVTKGALSVVMGAAALLQVPQVSDLLKAAVVQHPHLSVLAGAAITAASLLHQPRVIQALGLKTERLTTETEIVPLPAFQPAPRPPQA